MLDADTLQALLETISHYAVERLRPLEAKVSEDDAVPPEVIEEMKAMGLFGLSIPEEFGGLGLTMAEESQAMMALCHAAPVFRSAIGTNLGIGSQGLAMFGTAEQKSRWLPGIASGETITSFALTEPEAGSDSGSVQTRAVRDGDQYILNGTKRFITNAAKASLFTVMARTEPTVRGGGGVSAFLVSGGLPGLTVGKREKKMGQQGAHIHDVTFDNVRIPAENRLGAEGEGFAIAMKVLDRGRIHIASVCVGVAQRLIGDCVAYAQERRQFGKAIAEFQLIQAMIADSKTEALAARALVLEAARKRDSGEPCTLEAAAAKLFASEMVGRVADRAVQVFGGAGYVSDHGIERLYRDVRIFRIYEGTTQIQQLVVARETFKRGC